MRIPSLKHLQYLVSVYQYQHFGKAAKACFVSQSTLSSGISSLESILGVRLIERDNKNLLFTPLAEEVVKQSKEILLKVQELTATIERFSQPFGGNLKLGIIPTIAPFLLPQLLLLVKQTFPDLKIYIREEKSNVILEQLDRGELDLVVLALPYPAKDAVMKSFHDDQFYFAHHKDTHYQVAKLQPDYSNLEDDAILLLEDGHCLRDHALAACHLQQSTKLNPFAASSLHTLVQMVNNDMGVTFLPAMAIDAGILAGTDVVLLPLPDAKNDYREIGFAWRRRSIYEEEINLLFEEVKLQIRHFLSPS